MPYTFWRDNGTSERWDEPQDWYQLDRLHWKLDHHRVVGTYHGRPVSETVGDDGVVKHTALLILDPSEFVRGTEEAHQYLMAWLQSRLDHANEQVREVEAQMAEARESFAAAQDAATHSPPPQS